MPVDETQFRLALLDPDVAVPAGLRDGAGGPAGKRFDVYRNNVTAALIEALRTAFPVLNKLLGSASFDHLARLFALAHPPKSPLMMHYGTEMPLFLEAFGPFAHIEYLPDIARLELALRRSYHAADTAPFDANRLAAVNPDALMASTLTLSAAVELVPSPWPLVDIWRFNSVAGADKPRAVAQAALVTRATFDPVLHPLVPDEAAWIQSIQTGATLAAAQDAACAHSPEFNLTPLLSLLIRDNAIADMTTPKEYDQ